MSDSSQELALAVQEMKERIFSKTKAELLEIYGRNGLEKMIRVIRTASDRIKSSGWKYYVPQWYQMPFHTSQKRFRAIFGGNRTGKTITGCWEMACWFNGFHPYQPDLFIPQPATLVTGGESQRQIRMYYNPYVFMFLQAGTYDVKYIRNEIIDFIEHRRTGTRWYICSYDQERSRWQSFAADAAHLDEEPPQDVFNELTVRLLDKKGHLWMSMTPLNGLSWSWFDIFGNPHNDPEYEQYIWDMEDNVVLDKDEISRVLQRFKGDEKRARKSGMYMGQSGVVYPWLQDSRAYCRPFEIPAHWPRIRVIDPAGAGWTACIWVAVDPQNNLWIYREYKQSGMTIPEHCFNINRLSEGETYIYDIIDKASLQRNPETMRSMYQLYHEYLYRGSQNQGGLVPCPDRDIEHGISATEPYFEAAKKYVARQMYDHPFIRVFEDCTEIKAEAKGYIRNRISSGPNMGAYGKPVQKDNHLMDTIRYLGTFGVIYQERPDFDQLERDFTSDPVTGYRPMGINYY